MSRKTRFIFMIGGGLLVLIFGVLALLSGSGDNSLPSPEATGTPCPLDDTNLFVDQRCADMKVIAEVCQVRFDDMAFNTRLGNDRLYYYVGPRRIDDPRIFYPSGSSIGIQCPDGNKHEFGLTAFNDMAKRLSQQ